MSEVENILIILSNIEKRLDEMRTLCDKLEMTIKGSIAYDYIEAMPGCLSFLDKEYPFEE